MLADWENQFDEVILERGLDYYSTGRVDIIDQDEGKVIAVVDGSGQHSHQVKVSFISHQLTSMSCTCPYACEGANCKHMAAALYALEAGRLSHTGNTDGESETLQSLIAAMPEADAKNLLLTEAQDSPALCNYIHNVYGAKGVDFAGLRHEIVNIKRRHADHYGFIDYSNAFEYEMELERFMEKYIRILIQQHNYKTAFELVCYIYRSLDELEIDDSGGEITMLASVCVGYWQEIIDKCSQEDEREFFRWFKDHQHGYATDYLQSGINDFFIDYFHEPEMLKQKLDLLNSLIAEVNSDDSDQFTVEFYLERYLSARLRVMNELSLSPDEFTVFYKKYYDLPVVRQFIVTKLIKEGETEKAIKVLKESKQIDHKWPGLAAEASKQLMQLYQETGQKQLYRQEIEEYVSSYRQDDLEYVELLKQLCSKSEWKKKRQELLQNQMLCSIKYEFMIREGLYKQFLSEASDLVSQWGYSESTLSMLDRYEHILAAKYPEAVRDLYTAYVRKSIEYANSRPWYQTLVEYLQKIVKYPTGEEIARRIVAEWRESYRRRSALMDELRRGGF